ncbi:hypothetical protein HQ865_10170 [Mucilaginibacter mali]|uniref:Uncharacterized protein n=1 Tax=Mucilaginibacter mali TaxID=2740462 RepID=A0A7D4QSL5_9SPHI|nr:hypothetical protein [Mucilaginibacter mali]QKJ30109.1 hypothetical protein HQ865_10170 [Mucilaginibacter mali]
MKIRIKGNSIRYRLTRSEVERFGIDGMIKEATHFGNKVLSYVLQKTDAENITASFEDDTITLLMPQNMATEWTLSDRVGFENVSGELSLFIEKDFQCLDNVAEDQSDNYPNPLAVHNHE